MIRAGAGNRGPTPHERAEARSVLKRLRLEGLTDEGIRSRFLPLKPDADREYERAHFAETRMSVAAWQVKAHVAALLRPGH